MGKAPCDMGRIIGLSVREGRIGRQNSAGFMVNPLCRRPLQKSSGVLSTTSFMTKNVGVWRTPGSAISCSPWIRLKSSMSPTRILRKWSKSPATRWQSNTNVSLASLVDLAGRYHRPNLADEPLVEQALGPAVTCRGAYPDPFSQFGIAQPAAILQQTQYLEVDAVERACHGRIFHNSCKVRMKA